MKYGIGCIVVLLVGHWAFAQGQYVMPGGTPVGRAMVRPVGVPQTPVGQQINRVGSPPPGFNQLTGPRTNFIPAAQQVDQSLVIAPYPTRFGDQQQDSFWDRLYNRWMEVLGVNQPTPVNPNWTPGISRRNRARHNIPFRRD